MWFPILHFLGVAQGRARDKNLMKPDFQVIQRIKHLHGRTCKCLKTGTENVIAAAEAGIPSQSQENTFYAIVKSCHPGKTQ